MYYTPFPNTYTPHICGYNTGFQSYNSIDIMKEAVANILKQRADNRTDWSRAKKEQYKAYIDLAKRTDREGEKMIMLYTIYIIWWMN